MNIKRIAADKGQIKNIKVKNKTRRVPSGNLWMTAPVPELTKKLVDKGILKVKEGKWVPRSISSLIPLEIKNIILRYNSIIRGILNYYSFVDNKSRLSKVH